MARKPQALDPDLLEIIESFGDGAFRDLAQRAGEIIVRKLKERGYADPSAVDPHSWEPGVADGLLRTAWLEAMTERWPDADPDELAARVDGIFDLVALDALSLHDGGETRN